MGETVRENGIETTGETKRTNARDARTTTGERESGKGASKSRGNDEKMGEGGEEHDDDDDVVVVVVVVATYTYK